MVLFNTVTKLLICFLILQLFDSFFGVIYLNIISFPRIEIIKIALRLQVLHMRALTNGHLEMCGMEWWVGASKPVDKIHTIV